MYKLASISLCANTMCASLAFRYLGTFAPCLLLLLILLLLLLLLPPPSSLLL